MTATDRDRHPDDDLPYLERLDQPEPPHNIEAEQMLIGCILVRNETLYKVQDFLKPEHFYEELHGRIYDAAARMIIAGRKATPVMLKTTFENDPPIGKLTVPAYMGRCCAAAPSIILAEDYARTIYDLYCRREMADLAREMLHRASTEPIDAKPDAIIESMEQGLAALAERGRAQEGFFTMPRALSDVVDMVHNAYQRDGGYCGQPTYFVELDNKLGGLADTDLIVLAGRPGMGKSALASNIAFRIAERFQRTKDSENPQGCPVGFFALEMGAAQLAMRELAASIHIPSDKLRRGEITSAQFDTLLQASEDMQNLPLYIDQAGGLNVHQLCARARRMKVQRKIGLLVVDYLQLLNGVNRRRDSRTAEVGEITTSLKALAKELEIPVIAVSQLSREVEKRQDKRPLLSDLRESGSIEQDADVVMFVYRHEYYLELSAPSPDAAPDVREQWEVNMREHRGKAEIIVGKSRHGPTGNISMAFNAPLTKFSDLAREAR